MKKCSWCGKEYPDTVEQCPVDAQPLIGSGQPTLATAAATDILDAPPIINSQAEVAATDLPDLHLTDRQLRIFEVLLVCVIALSGTILYSTYHFLGLGTARSRNGYGWFYSGLHEVTALGLLWYVLLRRSRSLSDLGFSWTKKDIGQSILVWVLGGVAFSVVYGAIFLAGLTSKSQTAAGGAVGRLLFGGGVSLMTIVFQFINPFFEELIVRAYVMTEVRQLTNSISKAVILSTLLQMSYHFYQSAPMAFAEGATFLVFSLYYAKTNRITPIILAHLYMDVFGTLSYMFGHK